MEGGSEGGNWERSMRPMTEFCGTLYHIAQKRKKVGKETTKK